MLFPVGTRWRVPTETVAEVDPFRSGTLSTLATALLVFPNRSIGTLGGPLDAVIADDFCMTATGVFGMLSRAEASRTTKEVLDCTERAETPKRGAGDMGVPRREEDTRADATVDIVVWKRKINFTNNDESKQTKCVTFPCLF